jgi:hypothetical protein
MFLGLLRGPSLQDEPRHFTVSFTPSFHRSLPVTHGRPDVRLAHQGSLDLEIGFHFGEQRAVSMPKRMPADAPKPQLDGEIATGIVDGNLRQRPAALENNDTNRAGRRPAVRTGN